MRLILSILPGVGCDTDGPIIRLQGGVNLCDSNTADCQPDPNVMSGGDISCVQVCVQKPPTVAPRPERRPTQPRHQTRRRHSSTKAADTGREQSAGV